MEALVDGRSNCVSDEKQKTYTLISQINWNSGGMLLIGMEERTTIPTGSSYDVLCGKSSYNNPGNEFFRKLIQTHRRMYRSTTVRDEKRKVIEYIIEEVHCRGGRFLRSEGDVSEIPHAQQYEKVSHALRSARPPVSSLVKTRAEMAGSVDSLLRKQRKLYEQYCRSAGCEPYPKKPRSPPASMGNDNDQRQPHYHQQSFPAPLPLPPNGMPDFMASSQHEPIDFQHSDDSDDLLLHQLLSHQHDMPRGQDIPLPDQTRSTNELLAGQELIELSKGNANDSIQRKML